MLREIIKEIIRDEILTTPKEPQRVHPMVGETCLFRTYSAGVHFGELVEKEGKECLVKDARRIFYWAQACSLSQLAVEGSKSAKDCKIAMPVKEIILTEVIEIIPMLGEAIANLSEHVWKK